MKPSEPQCQDIINLFFIEEIKNDKRKIKKAIKRGIGNSVKKTKN